MIDARRYTAYCGLYCLDCIPSNKKFFQLISVLDKTLEELNLRVMSNSNLRKAPYSMIILNLLMYSEK